MRRNVHLAEMSSVQTAHLMKLYVDCQFPGAVEKLPRHEMEKIAAEFSAYMGRKFDDETVRKILTDLRKQGHLPCKFKPKKKATFSKQK